MRLDTQNVRGNSNPTLLYPFSSNPDSKSDRSLVM